LKTIQYGWPLGMPLVRHIEGDIWEARSRLKDGIARVFFVLDGRSMDSKRINGKRQNQIWI
jgi:phage-related protein